mmetsp:Transcript_18068/g.29439  ORF Transcript_18068/g.29439 Transcript_18068/m.29439 type:complete len:86 (+) Transcript_18068:561-818(+)
MYTSLNRYPYSVQLRAQTKLRTLKGRDNALEFLLLNTSAMTTKGDANSTHTERTPNVPSSETASSSVLTATMETMTMNATPKKAP